MRACLLLSISQTTNYGYALKERLRTLGISCNDSTMYRTLRKMEHEGLIEGDWHESKDGPRRRVYRLTSAGQDALDQAAVDICHLVALYDEFLYRVEI